MWRRVRRSCLTWERGGFAWYFGARGCLLLAVVFLSGSLGLLLTIAR
jgi:hypothetical protein